MAVAGENRELQNPDEYENDLLGILQESALYVELTPDEQNVLLKYVAEFYNPFPTGSPEGMVKERHNPGSI